MKYQDIAPLAQKIRQNISKVIIGKEEQLNLILAAFLAGGHVLLEDMPGTGKTVLAKSLAKSVACDFSRIQFTPDLLPADITGTSVFRPNEGKFSFVKGPVFTHILLADEINRATPRTQSALLECMEEKQVTEGGESHALQQPFFVIATQNPVETQGTFPLPEAQMDRFLIRTRLGYPALNEAVAILNRFVRQAPLETLEPVAEKDDICRAQGLVRDCEVSPAVMDYIARICQSTHNPDLLLGVSPRGMLALLRLSQSYAAIMGRGFVVPDDVKRLAPAALAHRIIQKNLFTKSQDSEQEILKILEKVPVPTEDIP